MIYSDFSKGEHACNHWPNNKNNLGLVCLVVFHELVFLRISTVFFMIMIEDIKRGLVFQQVIYPTIFPCINRQTLEDVN